MNIEDYYPKLDTIEQAKKAARFGAMGGLYYAGSYAVSLTLVQVTGESVNERVPLSPEQLRVWTIVTLTVFAAALFATWRVATGKGVVSSVLLLIGFVAETVGKISSGEASTGWLLIYVFIIFILITGVRATWAYRKLTKASPPPAS